MKNYNVANGDEIIGEISKRLPHISKFKIKLVYHLLQREIKISLSEGKKINIINFLTFYIRTGYVKDFWCVFHKKIRKTIINSSIMTVNHIKTSKIKNYLSKGKIIENVETRGLRLNQKYAYRTAQRADAKTKQGQKLR